MIILNNDLHIFMRMVCDKLLKNLTFMTYSGMIC